MVFTGLIYLYLYIVYFISIPLIDIYNFNYGEDYLISFRHNSTYLPMNPSIIFHKNDVFGAVRYTNDHKCSVHIEKTYKSEVRIVDDQYNTDEVVDVGKLHWCYHKTFKRKGAEDPRSFLWNDSRFSLITVVGHLPQPCNNKIYLYNHQNKDIKRLYTPFNNNNYMEKNWLPFIYKNQLHIEYFVNPRKIFKIVGDENIKYDITYCRNMYPNLHGSVNPVLINSAFYLGMAHDSNYNHLFYIFDSFPPFKIRKYSVPFNLHNNYTKQIEFITGMSLIKRKYVDVIVLSYSINDCINKIRYIELRIILHTLLLNDC